MTHEIYTGEQKTSATSQKLQLLKEEIAKKVVGQDTLVEMLIIGLLADGHILLEGLPGLAKTRTVATLSQALDLAFSRIQFTPDLLPSDVLGAEIYNTKTGNFEIKKGPIFSNFILADEINRAPSKVQSALLEAMAEKHITLGNETFLLERPFLVLATQNPIEQSGTYTLPEAQLDRFMFKVPVSYPTKSEEVQMYKMILENSDENVEKILTQNEIFEIQKEVKQVRVSDSIYEYTANIIEASRNPETIGKGDIKKYISYGVSPRGGLALIAGAKARALLEGRNFVIPEDIKYIAKYALPHRMVLSYEAVASDVTSIDIVNILLDNTKVL